MISAWHSKGDISHIKVIVKVVCLKEETTPKLSKLSEKTPKSSSVIKECCPKMQEALEIRFHHPVPLERLTKYVLHYT